MDTLYKQNKILKSSYIYSNEVAVFGLHQILGKKPD